jgi:hypothetical protein
MKAGFIVCFPALEPPGKCKSAVQTIYSAPMPEKHGIKRLLIEFSS